MVNTLLPGVLKKAFDLSGGSRPQLNLKKQREEFLKDSSDSDKSCCSHSCSSDSDDTSCHDHSSSSADYDSDADPILDHDKKIDYFKKLRQKQKKKSKQIKSKSSNFISMKNSKGFTKEVVDIMADDDEDVS